MTHITHQRKLDSRLRENDSFSKKFLLLFLLLPLTTAVFADTVTTSTSTPPPPPSSTSAAAAGAQVTLSQSQSQLDEIKLLFHHTEYKYLNHPKNPQKHLTLKTGDDDDNAN